MVYAGSKRVFWRKDVPSGGLVDFKSKFRAWGAETPNFGSQCKFPFKNKTSNNAYGKR